jgi:hypothetical protein
MSIEADSYDINSGPKAKGMSTSRSRDIVLARLSC